MALGNSMHKGYRLTIQCTRMLSEQSCGLLVVTLLNVLFTFLGY